MFSASVPKIFKIAGRASVVESLFSKVTGLLHSTTLSKILSRAVVVPESSFSRNFEKFLFNGSFRLTIYKLQGY